MFLFLHFAVPCLSQIRVVSPRSAAKQFEGPPVGSLVGSTATFGAPFYGERVLGRLIYEDPLDLDHPHCAVTGFADSALLLKNNTDELDSVRTGQSHVKQTPRNIFLVKRGGCSFVTKVRLVEKHFGAHAVIVVDKDTSYLTSETIMTIIMSDDGYGADIKIPSLLVSNTDGQKLIDAVKENPYSEVLIELEWDIPSTSIVVVDMWMSSDSLIANSFLKEFNTIGELMLTDMQFVPHYSIFSMNGDFNEYCYDDNQHQFCADDPDADGPLTGKEVVFEDLRQLCIWEVTAEGSKDATDVKLERIQPTAEEVARSKEYWEYLKYFLDTCPLDGTLPEQKRFGSVECAEKVMKRVGIPVDKVNYCMQHSAMQLLEHQLENAAWAPVAIRINGWRYAGQIERDLVGKAICSGFIKPPPICTQIMDPTVTVYKRNWTFMQVLYVCAICITIIGTIVWLSSKRFYRLFVRRTLQDEVMLEVQSAMADYKALDGDIENNSQVGGSSRLGRLPRWN